LWDGSESIPGAGCPNVPLTASLSCIGLEFLLLKERKKIEGSLRDCWFCALREVRNSHRIKGSPGQSKEREKKCQCGFSE